MKTAFIATSYKHRELMADVLNCISHQLTFHDFNPLIFVQKYTFAPEQHKEMMETSFQHIRHCDLFIAELTHKVVGVGIEAGYASAHQIPIIYVHQATAPLSTTMTGIANYQIAYNDTNHLQTELENILKQM